ncbi:MAG: GNAT family N-acetyltransferase [Paracoccaceae bacterium]
MTDIIFSDPRRDLRVLHDAELPPDLLSFLQATVWGQRGIVFRSLDMAEMLSGLARPSFLRLLRGDKTIAVAVRNRKQVDMAGRRYDAVHLALFAVHPDFTRQGYGTLLAQVSRDYYLAALREPGLLYGYIESGNEASLRLNLGIGYRDLGEVRTRLFGRVRPRPSARVGRLAPEERPGMLARLKDVYRGHGLCNFDLSLDPGHYFVLREGGEIVAGAQIHPVHWQLLRLPGWQGRLATRVLPHIPLLGRDFTPADLRFARVGSLYAPAGAEASVSEILEAVLAEQRLPFAAVLADPRGEIERRILDKTDFGLLDRGIRGAFHVVGEFRGVDDRDIETLARGPVVISPRDPL